MDPVNTLKDVLLFPTTMSLSILISVLTIVTQMVLSHGIRTQLKNLLTHDLLKLATLELVASAELCGTCYELIIIADNYGVCAYALFLFFMTIWWSHSWENVTACPYNVLEDYVENGKSLSSTGVLIAAQTIGGIASFRWVKQLWLMEFAITHRGRGIDDCSADLQVPVMYGFLIECILTCFCRLFSRSLGEIEPKFASAIDSFFGTSMVILAFNYSGGYFNPVLATGLKWGCKGHTVAEHVIVYWAGSIMGSMFSIKLWNLPTLKEKLVTHLSVLKPSQDVITNRVEEITEDKKELKDKSKEEKKED